MSRRHPPAFLPRTVLALAVSTVLAACDPPAGQDQQAADPGTPPSAEPSPPHAPKELKDIEDTPLSPKDAAIEELLSERDSPQAFDKAIAKARKEGVHDQVILEARFLFHVDRHEDDAIAALLPDFLERRDSFQAKNSAVFAVHEDWLAVIEYIQAITALRKGDKTAFKQHITEAFWLSPRQGAAFAPHIDRLRLDEAMAKLRFDFQTSLQGLLAPEPVQFAPLLADDRKGLLLHFWSPWARECEDTADDFAATARLLDKHRFAVVSVLAEDAPGLLDDARSFVSALPADLPCRWLLDRKQDPLAALFRVQDLPVVVLIHPDGRILFNGSPDDQNLWRQLHTIVPQIERPRVDTPAKQNPQ